MFPKLVVVYFLLVPILIAIFIWRFLGSGQRGITCRKDLEYGWEDCRPQCLQGAFSLPGMTMCRPWLKCADIEGAVQIKKYVGGGAVKVVYLAEWDAASVAYSTLINPKYKDDFQHGLRMLVNYQPHPYVTQLLGYCNNAFVTEYHRHGSAEGLVQLLESEPFQDFNNLATRFKLCINYIQIIKYLHNSSTGTRVMCDSNDLDKTLNQFLVTSDLELLVNDLDALPVVNHSTHVKIKCGHRQLFGDFVAPEQLWPYEDQIFSDTEMPGYDEKTDIWKVPNVCEHFLGAITGADNLRFHLFKIHKKCKNTDPSLRPTASQILQEYQQLWQAFSLEDE